MKHLSETRVEAMTSVLIVDDEQHIRTVVRLNFEDQGYTVIEATDGEEALRMIEQEKPDLIILDLKLPKVDGLGVLRKLQSQGADEHRVVMLTGATGEEDHLRGYGAGADEYVTKPFEPEDLMAVVEDVLSKSAQELKDRREQEIDRARLLRQLDRFLE